MMRMEAAVQAAHGSRRGLAPAPHHEVVHVAGPGNSADRLVATNPDLILRSGVSRVSKDGPNGVAGPCQFASPGGTP